MQANVHNRAAHLSLLGHAVRVALDARLNDVDERKRRPALRELADDPTVEKGAPILIFFAGHGAQTSPPLCLSDSSGLQPTIQMLLPYNFHPCNNDDPQTQGLYDFTLCALLQHLGRCKGNNIVRGIYFLIAHSFTATILPIDRDPG